MYASVIIALGLVCVTGSILCFRGLRGVRVGDHAFCAGCGYDLHGITPSICPECGTDLSIADATVIGTRRRRKGSLALGIALFLGGAIALGFQGWKFAQDYDWQPIKP